MSARAVVEPGPHEVVEDEWTPALGGMIRRAALDPRVERIFVAPGIKKKLCETTGSDRDWLRRCAPIMGTTTISTSACPARPAHRAAPRPRRRPATAAAPILISGSRRALGAADSPAPDRPLMLADLPSACRTVLQADPVPGAVTMRQAFAANVGLGGVVAPAPASPVSGNRNRRACRKPARACSMQRGGRRRRCPPCAYAAVSAKAGQVTPVPPSAAIAVRVLREILLVVVLGEVEGRRVADLRRDRPRAAAERPW